MIKYSDKIFVPAYGAGVVVCSEDKKINDKVQKYICISLLLDNMKMLIPENKLIDYRIRSIVSEDIINDALKIINNEPEYIEKKWGKRYRSNNEKIHSGDIFKECEVARDLYYLKKNEIMPPGEQKILEKAEGMIASEISLVFSLSLKDSYDKLRKF
ncbi:MAG: CarD family transcriptional regulator [Bacillota bacterium]|nr:CarD family transcriptional regulator [Bacillota bacterium]